MHTRISSETVADTIIVPLQKSPFFALRIDETTDVAVTKELAVYGRYIVGGVVLFAC